MQQLLVTVNALVDRGITLVSIKENLRLSLANSKDLQSKVIVALFSILYEVERDMISERTKRGLERARAGGKTLGRPDGKTSRSKRDGEEEEISVLAASCPLTALARKFGCDWARCVRS
jgi:DNA invertase Pin-like site-specific DNA recombinase